MAARAETRFKVEKAVLVWDRLWEWGISVGGVSVIIAVMGICVFIFAQILPLFSSASVSGAATVELPKDEYRALAVDEWTELPILVRADGSLLKIDMCNDKKIAAIDLDFNLEEGESVTAATYQQRLQQLTYGTSNGRFFNIALNYTPSYVDNKRQVIAKPRQSRIYSFGAGRSVAVAANLGERPADGEEVADHRLAAAIQEHEGKRSLRAILLKAKKSLMGGITIKPADEFDLTSTLHGTPEQVLVNDGGNIMVAGTKEGDVYYYMLDDNEQLQLVQRFRPFEDKAKQQITSIAFLMSDVSLSVTGVEGESRIFSLFVPEDNSLRLFGMTREFPKMRAAASLAIRSERNKAFMLVSGKKASLRYMTTNTIRWEEELPFTPKLGRISGKYDGLIFLDGNSKLHIYNLHDRYPEAGMTTYFAPLWYEGYAKPEFTWQSESAEPKMSMVPLVYGSLKGTFYAMLFAVPIALLAALYTSQFQHGPLRKYVKPTMEVMASLPSVVLGFLAALWLAPKMGHRVPGILLFIVSLPLTAGLFGYIWWQIPIRFRRWLPEGREFLLFAPMIFLCWFAADWLGPILESKICTVTVDGREIADFRRWWPTLPFIGGSFEERNSLVVGFMMGFAVIPIIFTISEDAMSNVPPGLVTASTALGASRWQTAIRIVLPTASAGIFSAVMMGLGRAVGETMIVVMATGNTGIMEANIFNGMRTLSANIAVELPEAAAGETLYRSLFLGAFILFLMTFAINTLAELLRQHLRNKYKTV